MESHYKIVWTSAFKHDYAHEYEYSVKNWGQIHAEKFFDELDQVAFKMSFIPVMSKQGGRTSW